MENEFKGIVVHGKGKGKTVGMPTANIDYKSIDSEIENGVYASVVCLFRKNMMGESATNEYIGVTNIGTRPSVDDDDKITVETNILDFDEDIYGEEIKIFLLKKIRDIKKFESLEAVKVQVEKDKEHAREIYKKVYHKYNDRGI